MNEKFIRNRISQLRKSKGVSGSSMSIAIEKNENYINEIENGKALPSIPAFLKICEYFLISPKEFFDEEFNSYDLSNLIKNLKTLTSKQLENVTSIVEDLAYINNCTLTSNPLEHNILNNNDFIKIIECLKKLDSEKFKSISLIIESMTSSKSKD